MPEISCERPQLAEPGSHHARACGDCPGCHGDERRAAAAADGRVALEVSAEQAARLLVIVRNPAPHRAGDAALAELLEAQLDAFRKLSKADRP